MSGGLKPLGAEVLFSPLCAVPVLSILQVIQLWVSLMGNRGREKMVRCEQCGRQVRRDKAVVIEKVMLSNPLERHQVSDEQYTRVIMREVAYCPSCGKHGRIYEKKKRQNERQREHDYRSQYRTGGGMPKYNTGTPARAPAGGSASKPTEAPAPSPSAAPVSPGQ